MGRLRAFRFSVSYNIWTMIPTSKIDSQQDATLGFELSLRSSENSRYESMLECMLHTRLCGEIAFKKEGFVRGLDASVGSQLSGSIICIEPDSTLSVSPL